MADNKWDRFYTPKQIATKIINLLDINPPNVVADICAGSGNLLEAAHDRWPESKLLAIDVDFKAIENIKGKFKDIDAECFDAVDMQKLNVFFDNYVNYCRKCDLVVANPPFGYFRNHIDRTKTNNKILNILSDEAKKLNRIEAYMLISNILFLKPGGYFAAILPENIFTSQKWNIFKKIFINTIFDTVHVSSPGKIFRTDVNTRIFIGKLRKGQKEIKLRENGNIIQNNVEIIRGSFVSESKYNDHIVPVFHSDCFKYIENKIKFGSQKYISHDVDNFKEKAILKKNDIVIIRVGRNCGNSAIITKDYFGWHISDCVYIVRQNSVPNKVLSINMGRLLPSMKKGLACKYITERDILKVFNNTVKKVQSLAVAGK